MRLIFLILLFNLTIAFAQQTNTVSKVWVSDNGDGTYTNPILHADYSDPDVVRVGEDYFMTASSFTCSPSLPILHSKDLVNWELVNYALTTPADRIVFDKYIPVKAELQKMADLMVRFKLIETATITGLVEDRFAREANIDSIDGISSILAN